MSTLLTEELKKALPKLCEQEGSDDPVVYAIFFFPLSSWIWFVTEGEPRGDDFIFFGYVIGFEREWGYFSSDELEEVKVHGLRVQRDRTFKPTKLSTCLSTYTCDELRTIPPLAT